MALPLDEGPKALSQRIDPPSARLTRWDTQMKPASADLPILFLDRYAGEDIGMGGIAMRRGRSHTQ